MKKIVYIISITFLLLLSSCSKWLDVKPKAEIKSDVMFESEQGFKDALIGCYIGMSDFNLYGGELSLTFLDVLAQQYDFSSELNGGYLFTSKYMYTNSYNVSIIDKIWEKAYNTIANLNNIIENLEKKKSILHPTSYALIKAEAYGLRAFLHFDLMRMFSFGNLANRKGVYSEPAIPYVTVYDNVIVKQSNVKEVFDIINSDINISIELLKQYDPWSIDERPEGYSMPVDEVFYNLKNWSYRFNIKAAIATRMRINMWTGSYEEALKDASYLIQDLKTNWISDGTINTELKDQDLTFSKEQLFGLEAYKRFENYVRLHFKPTMNDGFNRNTKQILLSKTRANQVYEIAESIGSSDYRYRHWFDKTTDAFVFMKFWEIDRMVYTNNIPLIRKSEIYYNAAECLLNKGDEASKVKAIGYINDVRNARGIPMSININDDLSANQVKNEIYKEWKKEFIGDGQMFYYYKRLGYSTIPGTNTPGDDNLYIFPLPEKEIDFGGRIDINKK